MMWVSGIRGAVAFALALNMRTAHRSQVITTTLFLCISTTLILGCCTSPMLKILGLQEGPPLDELSSVNLPLIQNSEEEERKSEQELTMIHSPVNISWTHRYWRKLDERFMKPLFGGNPRETNESQ